MWGKTSPFIKNLPIVDVLADVHSTPELKQHVRWTSGTDAHFSPMSMPFFSKRPLNHCVGAVFQRTSISDVCKFSK